MECKIYGFVVLLILTGSFAKAQQTSDTFFVKYTEEEIKIDGILDEEIWNESDSAYNFYQYFPTDSLKAQYQTIVKLLYNKDYLYVAIKAECPDQNFVAASLRRDFWGGSNDNVSVLFDTFSDGNNAFLFGITPYGVRREAFISNGGDGSGFNLAWDMKWRGDASFDNNVYFAEMAIPFNSMKFPEGSQTWRFQSYRFNVQSQEQSAWVRVPQNQDISNLAFMKTLTFEKKLGKSRTPIAIIPYVNGLVERDYENNKKTKAVFKVGGDAKLPIGNSMNADLTFFPDFSNVEVDNIFTNLTRFEIQLPERRQFFIDNNDLFGSYGSAFGDASPFFSRRIGLQTDTADATIENRIIGGGRISGKIDKNWRLGLLNIQTEANIPNEIPSNNNMMIAVQRKIFSRSNIGAFFINRETFKNYEFLNKNEKYNRVFGIDYNLASKTNVWSGKFYVHKSLQPDDSQDNWSSQAMLQYNTRFWNIIGDITYIDDGFNSDLGFIPRNDILRWGLLIGKTFYPKKTKVNTHGIELLSVNVWRPGLDFLHSDMLLRSRYRVQFRNQSNTGITYFKRFTYLTEGFNPTNQDDVEIPANVRYPYGNVELFYESNNTKKLTYLFWTNIGNFYNGQAFSGGVTVGYRWQPWVNFRIEAQYDGLRLPKFKDANYWLLTPRVEVTLTRSIFWTTTVQFSNQRDNLGINSRIQWRYAPLSDLFIVYNDNYFVDALGPKYRSINLKLSYWFNP